MEIGETLYVTERSEWRAWLEAHHADRPEIWMVFPVLASGRPRLGYNDAVEEALCFGWIDSIVKKLDNGDPAQRFSPRRRGSFWSQTNKERMARLLAEGKVHPSAMPDPAEVDPVFEFPRDIIEALRADRDAWRHFKTFPEPYKRIRIAHVEMARSRPEDFDKRLANLISKTARGVRFGHDISSFY